MKVSSIMKSRQQQREVQGDSAPTRTPVNRRYSAARGGKDASAIPGCKELAAPVRCRRCKRKFDITLAEARRIGTHSTHIT